MADNPRNEKFQIHIWLVILYILSIFNSLYLQAYSHVLLKSNHQCTFSCFRLRNPSFFFFLFAVAVVHQGISDFQFRHYNFIYTCSKFDKKQILHLNYTLKTQTQLSRSKSKNGALPSKKPLTTLLKDSVHVSQTCRTLTCSKVILLPFGV